MQDPTPEPGSPALSRAVRRGSLGTLLAFMFVGWLVYEVTDEPALAAMLACLKFGWNDFLTARWLRRTDPVPPRGRACFWLYLASGLWKAALMGVLLFVLVAFLAFQPAPQPGPGVVRQNDPPPIFIGGFLTAFFGFTLSTLASFVALARGWRHGVKFWLSPAVHNARENGVWPPLYGRTNTAGMLLLTALILSFCVLGPVALLLLFVLLDGAGVGLPAAAQAVVFAALALVAAPAFILLVRDVLAKHFIADHPADCWGTDPLPEPDPDALEAGWYNDTAPSPRDDRGG